MESNWHVCQLRYPVSTATNTATWAFAQAESNHVACNLLKATPPAGWENARLTGTRSRLVSCKSNANLIG